MSSYEKTREETIFNILKNAKMLLCFHIWSLFLIMSDLKFEFYTSKSSPGTPPPSWKSTFDEQNQQVAKG